MIQVLPFPRTTLAALGLAALALVAGCDKHTTRPPVTDLRLRLSATPGTGSAAHPVTLDVEVTNAGDTRMWHSASCIDNGIELVILDPQGERVALRDPRGPWPLCPVGYVPLEPGGHLSLREVFTGTLFVRDHPGPPSPTYAAPPGTYTVIAVFGGEVERSGKIASAKQQTTFDWRP